ncbi:DUF1836 domain-containing protein [Bacillus sp. PS06]|uniref:DUF1836 domain-containing protein n=1 Tax=Bacillus sp. PS06 TaxID=2764176 RepID=UPI001782CC66|nr:DUF1836 domain-containing protein [Bacillus sp. PS06]MBD8070424.1 DUF1836 domain-containing protein [Bacillus sp. PS06]
MAEVKQLLESMGLGNQITLNDIPDIDLYMDQVIQLFDNKFSSGNQDEKILTKTMINNYAKSGLLIPIKNKKYSKEHLILLSLIYQLKGNLKINEIKQLLQKLNDKILKDDFDLKDFYSYYLDLLRLNETHFTSHLSLHFEETKEIATKLQNEHMDYLEKVLLISSLAQMSNLYRSAAEKLVNEMTQENKE